MEDDQSVGGDNDQDGEMVEDEHGRKIRVKKNGKLRSSARKRTKKKKGGDGAEGGPANEGGEERGTGDAGSIVAVPVIWIVPCFFAKGVGQARRSSL